MKIGIDARLWSETGIGRYIRNLIWQLQAIDKTNEYILFVKKKDYKTLNAQCTTFKNDKWRVVEADIHWHSFAEQFKLPEILYKENLDLMHFPYFAVPLFYHKIFVVTIHDLINDHFPTGRTSTLPFPIFVIKYMGYKFTINQAAHKAKKIITVSNATKKEIIDHLKVPSKKIVVTYEGVDERVSSINRKNEIRNMKYFLYVGNAYPHKNLERLIEAFKALREKNHEVKLILVGKEDFFYNRLRKKIADINLQEDVLFYQNIEDEELGSLYKNALAVVVPSLMEGFGLPALEAMSLGCVVLASDIPALREVCGDSVAYFDPLDVRDIRLKMQEVLGKLEKFESYKKKGILRAKEFSWKKMAQQTLEIYESCLSL